MSSRKEEELVIMWIHGKKKMWSRKKEAKILRILPSDAAEGLKSQGVKCDKNYIVTEKQKLVSQDDWAD